ncbi:MAG: GNAT family N-acetyltransferase [Nitrososphaerota archaeon]
MRSPGVLEHTARIEVYDGSQKQIWDEFVHASKNGTFLFYRSYMDYHRDRFQDYSLLVWVDGQLTALFPANRIGSTLVSHGGLTYGGFITGATMGVCLMVDIVRHVVAFLRGQGFRKLVYKAIPYIYHRLPAEEDRYALFRLGARLCRRDVTTTVIPGLGIPFQKRRRRCARKAMKAGVEVGPSEDFESFWPILEWNLATFHQKKPVHTLEEMKSLHLSFPEHIKLYIASLHGEAIAGALIYETPTVAHAQYIASSALGRSLGALDLLFSYLIEVVYRSKPYFDFGVSTEAEGWVLNTGLVEFKEGFGGRTVTHDFYELDLIASRGDE